ncbi:uncharacterized protein LOC124921196 [Impatiens glandulifera]|uniref:uncharacterized protein LOC124921196 n=1 Tax=Impatiens glandulifera TaxID=253017 RepID=UPI001FB167CE|nr:uncharacterized protein LOC124921196 [Impatiens glandulifera]XP_047317779.1 uncharacterized protein LOC124921196 [Impatiens glandulifera]XP_047317780.1 uncharacterized protein LOC124921196 [Impatiens glandulifera]
MRAPSLFAQCLPGLLLPHDQGSHSLSAISDRDMNISSPAVEIIPSKMTQPYKYAGESIDLHGFNVFKGRVSVADLIGLAGSEIMPSKPDGSVKAGEISIDLVNVLKHEIRDGQLSFRGKRVLELNCSYGLPGIFACLKGAATVHFQDLNAETVRCTTIPNVMANLEQARERQSRQPETPLTPSRQNLTPSVQYFAGGWEELPTVLSVVRSDQPSEVPTVPRLSYSEEDLMDACSSQDESIVAHESSSRRSRKLSRSSRAWERACETEQDEDGYDVILMNEIPCSLTSLKKIYALIKKCLKPPYGVIFLGMRKNYVGFNSAARQLRSLVDEEGIFGTHIVKETADREVWKFFSK